MNQLSKDQEQLRLLRCAAAKITFRGDTEIFLKYEEYEILFIYGQIDTMCVADGSQKEFFCGLKIIKIKD